jgi:hypothetical protein
MGNVQTVSTPSNSDILPPIIPDGYFGVNEFEIIIIIIIIISKFINIYILYIFTGSSYRRCDERRFGG